MREGAGGALAWQMCPGQLLSCSPAAGMSAVETLTQLGPAVRLAYSGLVNPAARQADGHGGQGAGSAGPAWAHGRERWRQACTVAVGPRAGRRAAGGAGAAWLARGARSGDFCRGGTGGPDARHGLAMVRPDAMGASSGHARAWCAQRRGGGAARRTCRLRRARRQPG